MKRVMIDIETLSTKPDAIIAEIGMVVSEPLKPDFPLFLTLNWQDQQEVGRAIDVNTLLWWTNTKRADTFLKMALGQQGRQPLFKSLDILVHYLRGAEEVWANSPSFDLACLNSLLDQFSYQKISYKIERDFRTARALRPTVAYEHPVDAHNALADAQAQVAHLRKLGIWPEVEEPAAAKLDTWEGSI